MAYILHIETATSVCSVAVSSDDTIVFEREELQGPSHASVLGVFVKEAIDFVRAQGVSLDAVAVSCGPGSYTGLRIGVSEAKGLAYGLNIPVIALETLTIMAAGVLKRQQIGEGAVLCPMIDARRMEVYDVLLNTRLEKIRPISADIIDETSFASELEEHPIYFFGDGAAKCQEVIRHDNAIFVDAVYPKASDMAGLALKAYEQKDFVDVAYFEPFYLKEFVATTPKNKVLGTNL
ncbi:tRNA (adenosine(37)-N6)-threonylcarbamoyltransferase complex dimerization subunit type 1 TsaB [Dysgonomonas sp. 25]|uniref:tRNA (adenosine(37)-N6)-threonylcarbamoyltransferase complex dimerization subunit type 1 TsaB n=1 Tax=Dysgonomonas sp. 25 TaxID=2302933 RepID=UPI0013D52A49|nr:tRNA (adenosine(37)-N6)-threonylcarbamoyltransferase complex dimerization subunit type 1 TsaB [Dysgonomonas sp. 25]NDV67647.1 tRNA (adenosine(37)-N6)-threonylcarbamoyltransferase complex dimerization subunit type 1 TsaB [Dysgonomonas sp. 25]